MKQENAKIIQAIRDSAKAVAVATSILTGYERKVKRGIGRAINRMPPSEYAVFHEVFDPVSGCDFSVARISLDPMSTRSVTLWEGFLVI